MENGSSVVNIERTRDLNDVYERWSTTLDERYVNVAVWTSPAGKREVPPLRAFMLSYMLGRNPDVTRWINGRRAYKGAPAFALGVFPAHDETVCWEHSAPAATLGVYLAPGFLERAAAENGLTIDTESMPQLWDCQSNALRRLGSKALSAGPVGLSDEMFRDALTHEFAVHLLETYQPDAWPRIRSSQKFTSRVRQRVVDYVEANLSHDITLNEISVVAEMSRYHFSRLFAVEFGTGFHRYVLGRRIDESLDVLRNSDESLAQVALQFGFSSQSHYTTRFRGRMGCTPGAFRRTAQPSQSNSIASSRHSHTSTTA